MEEIQSFENYLIRKHRKIWNLVYAAFKYHHLMDLYFQSSPDKSKKDQFIEILKEIQQFIQKPEEEAENPERTCNHFNP